MIRFEDFVLSLNEAVEEVIHFYGLAFDNKIKEFLETHTKEHKEEDWLRTHRNSSAVPFQWTKELPFDEVEKIQENCREAMILWGYKEANSSTELQDNFHPFLPFHDFD